MLELFISVCFVLVSVRTVFLFIRLINFGETYQEPAPVSINAQDFRPSTLTITTGCVTVLTFLVNSALGFLSQIGKWCLHLKQLNHVLLLRHCDTLCWLSVQLRQSFFLASINLRSSILLTDSHSLAFCPDFSEYIQTLGLGFRVFRFFYLICIFTFVFLMFLRNIYCFRIMNSPLT